MALSAYRDVIRSIRKTFQGDSLRLNAALTQARVKFEENKNIVPDSSHAAEYIKHAKAVARILRENIVQGRAVDQNFTHYKLRFHEYTQLKSNNSFRSGGCCSVT